MKTDVSTLSNGLTVILADTGAFPTLSTLLLVGAGSRYENEKNNGVAHFFEHMAFKGSKKYPNSFVITSKIEGLGGAFNAFTSKDHTGYYIKATTAHFEEVLDVIADMVQHSLLEVEEIEREKGVIREEINLYEDTPYRKIGEIFESFIYPDNPLGFDIAGTKDTVSAFTKDTFVDYIKELYHPDNAVLVVAGGLDKKEQYLKIIEEKFKGWTNFTRAKYIPIKEDQKSPQLHITTKKTEQAHFVLGFRAFDMFDKRRYALTLLTTILGGGMSSRLFTQVRERRGLCYYISTGRELYADCGTMTTQAGVTNDLKKVKEAISVILKEHKDIISGNIKKDEFDRARELVRGSMLLSLEDSFNVAAFLGRKKLLEGKIITPEETLARIDKVTIDEVIEVARDIIKPEGLNFAIIGPFEKGDITIEDLVL